VRLRKGTLLIALVLLIGLGAGSASGATERLEEVSSFDFDHGGDDLAWDGEHLWATDANEFKIYKLDTSGNVLSSFNSPDVVPRGITWDGEHLWVNSSSRRRIYKPDTSGNVVSSFDPPSSSPRGLTWDGEHLWVSDVPEGRIYQLRVTTDNDNETQFSLNVSLDPPEGGSVTLDPPGGTYPEGTVVTLTAVPAENYGFAGWSGDISGTSSTMTVTMDSDKSVTAHFVKVGEPQGGIPIVWIWIGVGAIVAVIVGALLLKRR